MNKTELFNIELPNKTNTYQPISHRDIYEQTREELDKAYMNVVGEDRIIGNNGNRVITKLYIENNNYPGFNMQVAYRNSYDKSMTVGYSMGAQILVCSNGMVSGEMNFMRKHTGNVVLELQEAIVNTIQQLDNKFNKLIEQSEEMKLIELTKRASAELLGRMYIEEQLITATQLNIVKRQLENPSYDEFKDENLWSLYNHCTHSFKKAQPINYLKQHIELQKFVEKEYSI